MDQRAHDVEEDLKDILRTRLALGDKIQSLERRVEETVYGTKAAALEALDLARNKAADFIESTTYQLNPSVQAVRRPWLMVGSAIAVGVFAGLMEQRRRTGVYRYYPARADAADVMPENGEADVPRGVYPFYGREQLPSEARANRPRIEADSRSSTRMSDVMRPLRTAWDELIGELAHERHRLQETALYAGRCFIQDIVRIAGQSILDQLSQAGGSASQSDGHRRSRYE
jgi:hypothetical protein